MSKDSLNAPSIIAERQLASWICIYKIGHMKEFLTTSIGTQELVYKSYVYIVRTTRTPILLVHQGSGVNPLSKIVYLECS